MALVLVIASRVISQNISETSFETISLLRKPVHALGDVYFSLTCTSLIKIVQNELVPESIALLGSEQNFLIGSSNNLN